MNNKKYNIFIGITEIAGTSEALGQGLRELGHNVRVMNLFPNFIDRDKYNKWDSLEGMAQQIGYKRRSQLVARSLPQKIYKHVLALLHYSLFLVIFVICLFKYQVFIFPYASTFFAKFNYVDLRILKFFKKKIIISFLGSEARPKYLLYGPSVYFSNNKRIINGLRLEECYNDVRKQYRDIQTIEKYSDYILSIEPISHFISGTYIDFFQVGIPFLKSKESYCEEKPKERIRVLHAPSNPMYKGTHRIREVIANLQSKGIAIEYIEVSGVSRSKVFEELAKCDFIVDQINADTPLAGFVSEAASFGKPAVVGGYYSQELQIKDTELFSASYYCLPEDIEVAIEKMATNPDLRHSIARNAKQIISTRWDLVAIAKNFVKLIEDEPKQEWIKKGSSVEYYLGYAFEKQFTREYLRKYVEKFGVEGLCIPHNTSLQHQIVNFINEKDEKEPILANGNEFCYPFTNIPALLSEV